MENLVKETIDYLKKLLNEIDQYDIDKLKKGIIDIYTCEVILAKHRNYCKVDSEVVKYLIEGGNVIMVANIMIGNPKKMINEFLKCWNVREKVKFAGFLELDRWEDIYFDIKDSPYGELLIVYFGRICLVKLENIKEGLKKAIERILEKFLIDSL